MIDVTKRASDGVCLCCQMPIRTIPTLTSAFLSGRAWGGVVEESTTSHCGSCGFAFHGRGLRSEEIQNYYRNYRDEEYFRQRNFAEPFYTRAVHSRLEREMGGAERRRALRQYFDRYHIFESGRSHLLRTLDYGGGTGRLISELPTVRFVHDLSGEPPVAGVTHVARESLVDSAYDLVVCAQMLEHASDPKETAQELLRLVKPGGYLYVEVPYNETWLDLSLDGSIRNWLLSLAKKSRRFNIMLDVYGTACRVKLGILPPLAFVPVREHLNYFSPRSLQELGKRIGGKVIDASRTKFLGTTLLLQKVVGERNGHENVAEVQSCEERIQVQPIERNR